MRHHLKLMSTSEPTDVVMEYISAYHSTISTFETNGIGEGGEDMRSAINYFLLRLNTDFPPNLTCLRLHCIFEENARYLAILLENHPELVFCSADLKFYNQFIQSFPKLCGRIRFAVGHAPMSLADERLQLITEQYRASYEAQQKIVKGVERFPGEWMQSAIGGKLNDEIKKFSENKRRYPSIEDQIEIVEVLIKDLEAERLANSSSFWSNSREVQQGGTMDSSDGALSCPSGPS